ncbi:hypothetical protein CDL15_Pgr010855 [Punica granatum]|uniref:Fe2OG dioxygenase domain-containing protein n=2 Tax=Punica granatum TaxID=22663 RepID=A0A218W4Y9_PUNGR|nr:hypothetical protein CDL15_Pgr010855 [Punica granatum]
MATLKVSNIDTLEEKPVVGQAIPSNEAGEDQEPIPVIGHGIDKDLMNDILDCCREFFDLEEEEKSEYKGKHMLDPISYGASTDDPATAVLFRRNYLKVMVHPEFHSPSKPARFSKVLAEYSKAIRGVVRELLGGILESLGLESSYMDRAFNLESGQMLSVANQYPPCPQHELAMGLPPHTDPALLTVLIQNGTDGLQVQHKGKWLNASIVPGDLFVNINDQLEIFTNGKYKSVIHRAIVNNRKTRLSIAMANGPSLDTIINPAPELLCSVSQPAAYAGMKYKDYLEIRECIRLVKVIKS